MHGLAEPDLIGEHEARAASVVQMRIEGELHEILLMLPETRLPAVDRCLDERRGGLRVLSLDPRLVAPLADRRDHRAAAQAGDVLGNERR